jgi:hypothetical protein
MIYIILLLLSFISHWEWTSNLSILTSGDWIYQDSATLKELLSVPLIWSMNSLGSINLGISFSPFTFIYGLLANGNVSYGISERILFLWPILILLPLTSYLLIKNFIKNSIASAIGSLVYSYNTYFFEIKTGHLTLLAAFAIFPLVLLLYHRTLENRKIEYAVLTGFIAFIVSFYEFRAFYILCFILFFYFLFYIFIVEKFINIISLFKTSIIALLPVIIVFLLNTYWILPLANTGSLLSNFAFDRSLFGNQFSNVLHSITLHHSFWTGVKTAAFIVQPIPFYFWLIPFFSLLGIYVNRKNKYVLFFGFIAISGIFLSKQIGPPFGEIYLWLFNHLPGFNAFREASKFYVLIALGYSVIIAGFIDWLFKHWTKNSIQKFAKYILSVSIAIVFLWNLKPIITGEFATLFTPRQVPEDYLITKNFILKQNEFFRTYWVPSFSRWSVYTNIHPEVSAVDQIASSWRNFVEERKGNNVYTEAELVMNFLNNPRSENILNLSSIKYLFIPLLDKENDDDFFIYYGKSRQYYVDELNKIKFLKKIEIGTSEIIAYQNLGFRPHIYMTNKIESEKQNIPYKNVPFRFISPTEYKIILKRISTPIYISFSENYHPDWNIRIGDFNAFDSIFQKNYFLPTKYHTQNDINLNTFLIDPNYIQKYVNKKDYRLNSDGSLDLEFTLFFKTQADVLLGLIISIGTFTICLLLFVFFIRKHAKNK